MSDTPEPTILEEPEGFFEYKSENPDLFPDNTPLGRQYNVYLSALDVVKKKQEKKKTVCDGSIPIKEPTRVWKIIITEDRLKDQTSKALDGLADVNNPPFLFQRLRKLVRVNTDESGVPLVEPLSEPAMRGILERCCDFVKITIKGEEIPTIPPKELVQDVLSLPTWNTIYPLTGIIGCPYLSLDNELVGDQGYDVKTQLYYAPPPGFVSPVIPEVPTDKDVEKSVKLLKEIFINFPFVEEVDRTNTIAALLSVVNRPIISGAVPMFLINKPMPGIGASLISDVISIIATGNPSSVITAPNTEEEWGKKILSTLKTGRTLAVLDNLENKLYSPKLAALLTSKRYEDRILGISENISIPHRICWIGTGNNIILGGDLPRRCYMGNMSAETARPWQRDNSGFKHPNLLKWVEQNRTRILEAILTLTRNWILKGQLSAGEKIPKMGGFEEWLDVVGGIIVCSGMENFLGNLEQMYKESDRDTPQWELFFERWEQKYGSVGQTVAALTKEMKDSENSGQQSFNSLSLVEVLPDSLLEAWVGRKSFSRVFGNQLAKMNGRIFVNGLKFERGEKEHQAVTWKVIKVEKGELVK